MPDLVLYQPDIPGNAGTLLRLGACMNVKIHFIEPLGFRMDDKALKRAGMDYLELASIERHISFDAFNDWRKQENRRLLLLTTKSPEPYTQFRFQQSDFLMLGRESVGVPDNVHESVDHRLIIPMAENARSLNVAMSGAMVLGEALRQVRG